LCIVDPEISEGPPAEIVRKSVDTGDLEIAAIGVFLPETS
jgi:hypothetical protein